MQVMMLPNRVPNVAKARLSAEAESSILCRRCATSQATVSKFIDMQSYLLSLQLLFSQIPTEW
jgi:hypothetical protein